MVLSYTAAAYIPELITQNESGRLKRRSSMTARIQKALPAAFAGPMARHSGVSLVIKVFALASGFLFAVVAARLLGPDGYGQVSVALSTAAVGSTIALLGINGLAVREIAKFAVSRALAELRGYWRWALIVTACTSLLIASLLAALSSYAEPYSAVLLIAALLIPASAFARLLRALSQGAGQVVSSQIPMDVVRWVVMVLAVGTLLVAPMRASPVDVLLIALGATLISLVPAALNFQRYLRSIPNSQPRVTHGRRWLTAALPFLGIMLFIILSNEINTIMLGWLDSPREAGLYQPISRIAPIMLIGAEAIAMPLAPRLAALWHEQSFDKLGRLVHRSTLASTIITAVISSFILALSPYILSAFGPEFLEYRHLLFVMAAAQLVSAAMGDAPLLLVMVDNMRARIALQVVGLAVQVGLGVVLIPRWGAEGAAFALAGAILTWSFCNWLVALRMTGIDTSLLGAIRAFQRNSNPSIQ